VGGFYYQHKEDFMAALVQEQDQMLHTNGTAVPTLPFNFSWNMCRETQYAGYKQNEGMIPHLSCISSCNFHLSPLIAEDHER
jgi:hypothetical protein